MKRAALTVACTLALACGRTAPPAPRPARNVVLITIDTLRADHVGAYGYRRARTPTLDSFAAQGARFDRAFAAAPITLPSHATILTGRYPPGHGARDNGIRVLADVPTLATVLKARGFRTAAFVAAFPLDHQFGLARGFDVYGDRMPRAPGGRLADERPATAVVGDAIAWLRSSQGPGLDPRGSGSTAPFFLWVHLFEPHAPYEGDPARPPIERYDEEIARVDEALKPLNVALDPVRSETLVVIAGDHGEAFGEHGEIAHSIFVYDTTLRVPLIVSGPGVRRHNPSEQFGPVVSEAVTLADVAPTIARAVGGEMKDVDGIDLASALRGDRQPARELYAESFAPLVEFGWAPLRAIRADAWKLIAAPKPELYNIAADPGEQTNLVASDAAVARRLTGRVDRYSGTAMPHTLAAEMDPATAERLRALGYSAGSPQRDSNGPRPDPKDRRELAARIAEVTSGELQGDRLIAALESIVRDDPRNAQAHLRLGVARAGTGDCGRAEPELSAAIRLGLPSADAYVSLAACRGRRNDLQGAADALGEAQRLEPDNPVVRANLGILQAARGDLAGAIATLERALAIDPDLHEARFNLALAYARAGRRANAEKTARDLLSRLPAASPQRGEAERLLRALQ